ncbi:DNA-binding protein [Amnibacterium endophyticum]|uniref:DNA-binding protein n=1 Tax=Amnibacterium endophyticum TaxID=2109337 RepID=A0ABW4LE17_9MICO
MFVLTVDQVGSQQDVDRVGALEDDAERWRAAGAVLGPDRTAGDEFQLVLPEAEAALQAVLELTRDAGWSVGVGVGGVAEPLPASTREARGPAFVAARAAVEAAKRAQHRVDVRADDETAAGDATALLQLLLDVRARRSEEGWAVADRLRAGLTQAQIADEEGVTPQAVSQRARAAGIRLEEAAVPALARLLARLDGAA